jgi:hypothetical protein
MNNKMLQKVVFSGLIVFSSPAFCGNIEYSGQIDVQSDSYAYPVPFKPGLDNKITFVNVPDQTLIKIFTLDGVLVKTLHKYDSEGSVSWDAKNEDGNQVSSDVYVYRIQKGGEVKTGKLVVVK